MTAPGRLNRAIDWFDQRLPIITLMKHSAVEYPTPKNLNYWWNFGSLAGFMLVVMIVTGLVLAMQFTPHVDLAFNSVERIMRDVNYGWLIRYLHMNGASMFFVVVYIHVFRGLYYGSYKPPRELLWWIGLVILLLMMATAFMGYVLPWGQMSLWGATVITNLFSAVPVVGDTIVTLLWGGFSVDNPTLNRFFVLHFLLPFVIFGVVVLHVWALHSVKSNNPLGIDVKGPQDIIPFHPYYTVKDLFGIGVFLIAKASNGGALPPDLSLIVKAREGGPDYVFSLITGFAPQPPDVELPPGKYYNTTFPGHAISMPPQITDGAIEFADGAPNTADAIARDVTAFLQWASEPELEERHALGVKTVLFLFAATALMYALKRRVWAGVH